MLYQLSYLAAAPKCSLTGRGGRKESKAAIIGAALDLGAGRRGVDMGPSAIRYAGLEDRLQELGIECEDWGNVETAVAEATASGSPQARFLDQIKETCERIARAVARAVGRDGRRSSSAATTRSRSGRSAGSPRSTAPAGCSGWTPTAT